jgi:hypothetical protein
MLFYNYYCCYILQYALHYLDIQKKKKLWTIQGRRSFSVPLLDRIGRHIPNLPFATYFFRVRLTDALRSGQAVIVQHNTPLDIAPRLLFAVDAVVDPTPTLEGSCIL